MNHITQRRKIDKDLPAPENHSNHSVRLVEIAESANRQRASGAGEGGAWTKSLTKAVAFLEDRAARIVGVTGVSEGVGASMVARELARIYSQFDRRILFVSASGVSLSESVAATAGNVPDLLVRSTAESYKCYSVDLSGPQLLLPPNSEFFRYTFEHALNHFHTIVVDLAAPGSVAGRPTPEFLAVGPACGSILLICVTGRTKRADLQQCLASCKIAGAKIEGILLDDCRIPASKLVSD
jgi:hypothetical protein